MPIPTQINTTNLLNGKTALIVGGSGGIGYAIANSFLKNGAKVIIAGTHEEKLQLCLNISFPNRRTIEKYRSSVSPHS